MRKMKHRSSTSRAITLLLTAVMLVGCAGQTIPDLSRLYRAPDHPDLHAASIADQPPVILIHGAFGSRLNHIDTDKEYWPGGLTDILFSEYRDIALSINPETLQPVSSELRASGITDQVAGKEFYGAIMRTMEEAGGFVRGAPGEKQQDDNRRYYIFIYDWRQDIVQTARKLDDLIEQIRRDYASPNLKMDIVAHSMGGLVTRYYLRYGRIDVLDDNDFPVNGYGTERVNKVVLLGTPNLGSVSTLHEVLQGMKVGLRRIPTEVMATWPSTYQLFPHPIRTSMVTLKGDVLDRDLFDVNIWKRFEWSIYDPAIRQRVIENQGQDYFDLLVAYVDKHIERARRFVWSLSVPMPDSPVRYIVFGGGCELTPARLLVEEYKGESMVRLYPDEIANPLADVDYSQLMLEPGDGRVTKSSLFAREALDPTIPRHKYSYFPLDYAMMLCETHDTLTGNIHFQDNLLNVLLTRDKPAEKQEIGNK